MIRTACDKTTMYSVWQELDVYMLPNIQNVDKTTTTPKHSTHQRNVLPNDAANVVNSAQHSAHLNRVYREVSTVLPSLCSNPTTNV